MAGIGRTLIPVDDIGAAVAGEREESDCRMED
jgi:hypothetical protein